MAMLDPALEEVLASTPGSEEVEVIIRVRDPKASLPGVRIVSQFGRIMTCRVRSDQVRRIRGLESVISIKASRLLNWEPPIESEKTEYHQGSTHAYLGSGSYRISRYFTGKDIVVGAIDWGIDFASAAFRRENGKTRFLAIWDQSALMNSDQPNYYGYGRVYLQDGIDRALNESDPYSFLGYHPAKSDPLGSGSHGTHVLDIAAGSKRSTPYGQIQGIAPDAELIFVHLGTQSTEGTSNLGDSVRLIEALDFVSKTAGERPWVVNVSLGSHGGPHDGTTLVEIGMDDLLRSSPGRAICMSTGNYKQARTHADGRLRPGRTRTLEWIVDPADVTPNELEIWYSGRDIFLVTIMPPNATETFTACLDQKTAITVNGHEVGRLYHRKNDPNNHDNHIDIFLYNKAPSGKWKIILSGKNIADGTYHVWIERDRGDPRNQSRLLEADATTTCTIGSICNGEKTIAVGAFDSRSSGRELAPFSSCGFTRDRRQKPDLVAPGVEILAARSAPAGTRSSSSMLVAKSGASMAAPHVTGCLALVFQAASRKLDICQTHEIILGSSDKAADSDPNTNAVCSGDGYLDIDRAIEAILKIGEQTRVHYIQKQNTVLYSTPGSEQLSSIIMENPNNNSIDPSYSTPIGLSNLSTAGHVIKDEAIDKNNTLPSYSEDSSERTRKRNFILVSGGPGPYDKRDIEHDKSWANYVTPPLLLTEGPKLKEFANDDEEIWWFVYEPAYLRRWEQDLKNPKRKKEVERIKSNDFSSYVDLIEKRAKGRNWHLVWFHDSDDFWKKLTTFNDPISRLWYWGHARDELWLSLTHDEDGTPVAPGESEIITLSQIRSNTKLKDKFQSEDKSRTHRFIGCNTTEFAKQWAETFGVWTEGITGKIDFGEIHATGGSPALVKGARRIFFSPGGKTSDRHESLMDYSSNESDDSYMSEIDESLTIEARSGLVQDFGGSESYELSDYPEKIKQWFGGYTPTSKNQVTALIDGKEAFESMVQAMRMAKDKGDFIYFANWKMELDLRLIPTDKDSTLRNILNAVKDRVAIRALLSDDVLYEDPKDKNITDVHYAFFNDSRSNISFIPDKNFLPLGVHHQKILIVKAGERLIGFCGGVDFAASRLESQDRKYEQQQSPLSGASNPSSGLIESGDEPKALGSQHDVHCRIEGPAVWDLLQVFVNRWNDHPQKPKNNGSLSIPYGRPAAAAGGKMFVRIGTTFGCGLKANKRKDEMKAGIENAKRRVSIYAHALPPGVSYGARSAINAYIDSKFKLQKRDFSVEIRSGKTGKPWYDFAKNGDTSAWSLMLNAITQAKKYIYIEDQYLTSIFVAKRLNAQLSMNRDLKIFILIPHSRITPDIMTPFVYRGRFIKTLTGNKYPHERVEVYYRAVNKDHNYVHAKTWIFDDEFAVIGSANCGDRSMTHDSEVVAGIYDPGYEERTGSMRVYPSFAKTLRQRLWAHHLGRPVRDLANLDQAIIHWINGPNLPGSFVTRVNLKDVNTDDDNLMTNPKGAVGAATGQVDPRGDCSS